MPLTPAHIVTAQAFATAMQPERVGEPASSDDHGHLRRVAFEMAHTTGGDFREIARFLIEGI